MEHKGIKFWCYNAGHVLGAAMFMVEIAGVRLLYTGDYSMEDDRCVLCPYHKACHPRRARESRAHTYVSHLPYCLLVSSRHLMAAEVPYQYRPDILLVESTYGVQNHPPQEERERRCVCVRLLELCRPRLAGHPSTGS